MRENHVHSPCHLRERQVDGVTVVEPLGEIDLLTAPVIGTRLDVLTSGPCPELVVDLRAVDFIDCSGLAVLCRARNRADERGGRVRLVADSPRLLRVLRAVGLSEAFDVLAALPGAAAPVGAH
ncbi:hypothetical protein ADK57_36640 [Streptomyces sp. MMG1533]|uniref:STAS domain-containing protein n=1 Tax=Streptomyces sp. MMG1533 TaxID=1415546 RepID=UPI0006AE45B6|nr:STAS domain-containing protein [Streptomyces sp. MMG1533]KOU58106.1 hypothetical protein ADK57_36640 [Streptomyces sp. MMG1533]